MNPSLAHQSRRFQPSQTTRLVSRRRESVAATLKAMPLALALLPGVPAAWAQTYYHAQALPELEPQGGPSGQGWTLGWALNDSGVVVGSTQAISAVRWSFADGLQNIGSPARALAITNNGTAVGYLDTVSPAGVIPVRWSPTVGYQPLSDVYAGAPANGYALAVNDQDWVLAIDSTGLAFNGLLLLRPGQAALNLGQISPNGLSLGQIPTINATGMVAGWVETPLPGPTQGFVWTEAAGPRYVSVLAGGQNLFTSLNDNGLIVGYTSSVSTNPLNGDITFGPRNSFVYNANTGTVLESLPGFTATDINNAGSVVGIMEGGPLGILAAQWRNGAAVNLNSVTSNLGVYTLMQAIDINGSGQILALARVTPGSVPANYTGPALRTFLLSECARCGQIRPHPIAAGDTLDVASDWQFAFNAEALENHGTLSISTRVDNRLGAELINFGNLVLSGGISGSLANAGKLRNQAGATFDITGFFNNRDQAGDVENRGRIVVGNRGLVFNSGFWEQYGGSFEMPAGSFINSTSGWFNLVGGSFSQTGGEFTNSKDAVFRAVGVNIEAVYVINNGLFQLGKIGTPLTTVVNVDGVLRNGGDISGTDSPSLYSHRARLTVRNGSYGHNAGTAELRDSSRWTIEAGAAFAQHAGRFTVGTGTSLTLADDAYQLTVYGGTLAIEFDGLVTSAVPVDVWSLGRIENAGTLVLGGPTLNQGSVSNLLGGSIRLLNDVIFVSDPGSTLQLSQGSSLTGSPASSFLARNAAIIVNGLLSTGRLNLFEGGTISGTGVIEGHNVVGSNTVVDSRVTLRPGNSPGTLTFRGTTELVNALVEIEIENRRSFDQVVFDGPLTLGNVQVLFSPGAGYAPDLNDSFAWLSAGSVSGDALQIDASLLPAGWRSVSGTADGTLELWNDAAVALGPNPNPIGAVLSVAAGALAYNDLNTVENGTFFDNQGTVEVAGALANRPGAYFVQQDGGRLNVLAGGRLSNRGTITEFTGPSAIDNAGTLINYQDGAIDDSALANRGRFENDGTLNIQQGFENETGGEVVNRGQMSNIFTITNRGRFENGGLLDDYGFLTNTSGAQFVVPEGGTVEAGPFSFGEYRDFGGITQVDGRLQGNLIRLQGALLKGHGTLAGPVELVGAEVMPDAGTGLKIEGSATGSATFYIHWTGAGQYGRLNVTGDLDLQPSTVVFVLSPDGFVPQAGDSAQWLTIGGVAKGVESLNWRIVTQDAGAACAGCELYEWSPPAGTSVSFSGGVLSLQAAPEPELQSSALRLPDGTSLQVTLTFPVIPGYTYTVESNDSPGVTGWEPLPGAPHQTGTVIDTTTQSRRYYRLRRTSPDGN